MKSSWVDDREALRYELYKARFIAVIFINDEPYYSIYPAVLNDDYGNFPVETGAELLNKILNMTHCPSISSEVLGMISLGIKDRV